jgi:DNA helicase II / ATP-dependent DNA helicase PcrA
MIDIILGPPGTGKTTALIARVEDALARGVPPARVGYFSFTRRAAHEAIDRASSRFGLAADDMPFFSTLHSMCYRQLGIRKDEVLEGKKLREFAAYAKIQISTHWSYEQEGRSFGDMPGDRALFIENLARVRGVSLEEQYKQGGESVPLVEVQRVARLLAEYKHELSLVDFTDMLTGFVKSGVRLQLDELMIDESQDLSWMQWQVVQRLMEEFPKTAIAGDDDQAIYRWAGADVDHFIDMTGAESVLGQSYRVPRRIQKVAMRIIEPVLHRRSKLWSARADDGEVIMSGTFSRDMIDGFSGTTLVLARNSYLLDRHVEPELRSAGVLFERRGALSIRRSMLDAVRSWEHLRRGGEVSVAAAREVYSFMQQGDVARGHKTLPRMEDDQMVDMAYLKEHGGLQRDDEWYSALTKLGEDDVAYLRAVLRHGGKLSEKPRVTLSTIHGAKGGEADQVILLAEMAPRTWDEMRDNEDDERRVWFVAVTRARQRLIIVVNNPLRSCPWLIGGVR